LTDAGVELIFHIGIDTIRLQGDGFHPLVKEGQHVKSGDTLIEFSLDTITAAGLDPVVVMIVTNGERFSLTPGSNHDKDTHPHIIMTLKESV
jgi:PTS system beta-glucosides-specific IIC component